MSAIELRWRVDWPVKLPGDGHSQTEDHQRPGVFRQIVWSWEKNSADRAE